MSRTGKEKKIEKLLKGALRRKGAALLSGEEIEDPLLADAGSGRSHWQIERAEGRFAERSFEYDNEEPVRTFEGSATFGEWIRLIRSNAAVSLRAAAGAIEKDTSFIIQLESGDVLPWELPPADVARLVKLYRIHSQAVWDMVTELTTGQRSGSATHGAQDSRARHAEGRDTPPDEVLNWLTALNESLRQMGAVDLLE